MCNVRRRAAALAAGTLFLACSLVQIAADNGLPTAWRQGIATNYGGAQDGMVRCLAHSYSFFPFFHATGALLARILRLCKLCIKFFSCLMPCTDEKILLQKYLAETGCGQGS